MDDRKMLEMASALEDLSEVTKQLLDFSKDLMEQFAETGLLTVETKKDFDNLVFESENNLDQVQLILNAEEKPM